MCLHIFYRNISDLFLVHDWIQPELLNEPSVNAGLSMSTPHRNDRLINIVIGKYKSLIIYNYHYDTNERGNSWLLV